MPFASTIMNEDEDLEANVTADDNEDLVTSLGRNNMERNTQFTFKSVDTITTGIFLIFAVVFEFFKKSTSNRKSKAATEP